MRDMYDTPGHDHLELCSTGLPDVGPVPWGTHIGQFYRDVDDLIATLVPFFRVGLQDNDRCVWITSEPLPASLAYASLAREVPDLEQRIRRGQLEIIDHDTWYLRNKDLRSEDVCARWLAYEEKAQSDGYRGLRVNGNTAWLGAQQRRAFADYEHRAHHAFDGRRILALCSYPLRACSPDEIIDVVREHAFALVPRDRGWQVTKSATLILASVDQAEEPEDGCIRAVTPSHRHAVQFFRRGAFPAASITAFLREGVEHREGALVFASREHRRVLEDALAGDGLQDALTLVDAEPIADLIQQPEDAGHGFRAHVAPLVLEAIERHGRVRVYGEIVDLLSCSGRHAAALAVERAWNELLEREPVRLLCGYTLDPLAGREGDAKFRRTCEAHEVVSAPGLRAANEHRLLAEIEHMQATLDAGSIERRTRELAYEELRAAERDARLRAQAAMERLARLQRVTSELCEVTTRGEVAALVQVHLRDIFAADLGLLFVPKSGGEALELVGATGVASEVASFAELARDARSPVVHAFRTGTSSWSSTAEGEAHWAHLAGAAARAMSFACVPVVAARRCLGVFVLGFRATEQVPPTQRALLEDYVKQVALALDRARSYEDAHHAREHADHERLRAERANRAKDEFLAMLGHELRNPLSPMLVAVQLMRMQSENVLVRERSVIERQLNHMVRLVDDLLDVSRIARGKITLKLAPAKLDVIVASAIETTSPLLEERNHELRCDVPQGLVVSVDAERLAQVVVNLLTNAAKYTPPRGCIEVSASRSEAGRVMLRVSDNGVGIAGELLPHVFDLFEQGPQPIHRAQGGLGLGLAIARNLVELHGGTLQAYSAGRGKGSVFTLLLDEIPASQRTSDAPEHARVAPSTGGVPSLRVLVVDDNEDAAKMVAEALRLAGHSVRTAHGGDVALRVASEFRPQLALLDIGLPVIDGYELAKRFAVMLGDECPKLVAVSGYGRPHDRARSKEAGFIEHAVKPFGWIDLRGLIERLFPPVPPAEPRPEPLTSQ